MTARDQQVRGTLTRMIAARGYAPPERELAAATGLSEAELAASLRRLADAHALLLHPGTDRPWVVHPFALSPGPCWVQTPDRGYWASCVYCGFGIAAALRRDAKVHARLGGEAEPVVFTVSDGGLEPSPYLFHLSTPVAQWWDNVVHACASFQPFRNEADVDRWCAAHGFPKGAMLTMEQLWSFARDWYGNYLDEPWHPRSAAEKRALFARHGLTGLFWSAS